MKYLNLKKITAVVLSIGMVFSSSAVTGFAADNSKKIATIPNSYINKVADDIDDKYFYKSMFENKIVRDYRDGKVTKEELDKCSTCDFNAVINDGLSDISREQLKNKTGEEIVDADIAEQMKK